MNISKENQIMVLILEAISSEFNKYVNNEFDGSISSFVNRFVCTDSDMFRDVITYSERFANEMSNQIYGVYLSNIYLNENYKPIFELIFHMIYEEMFPDDINLNGDHKIVLRILRNDLEDWSIQLHEDNFSFIDTLSSKDFFLLKNRIIDPNIY